MDKNMEIELEGEEEVIEEKSEMVDGKEKNEENLPTKIVVRRLPPTMTKEDFKAQVSPLPPHDYLFFVQGESNGTFCHSRAYINFIDQEDIHNFTKTFHNHMFLDSKGKKYPAVVELSPFQGFCKPKSRKREPLSGTIENDPDYIAFKENLLAEASENPKASAIAKQHYFEIDLTTTKEVRTTPLLEFLKRRRADRNRAREERKEEIKGKYLEKRLKLNDKKSEEDLDSKDLQRFYCSGNCGLRDEKLIKKDITIAPFEYAPVNMLIKNKEEEGIQIAQIQTDYLKNVLGLNKINLEEEPVKNNWEEFVKTAERQSDHLKKVLGIKKENLENV